MLVTILLAVCIGVAQAEFRELDIDDVEALFEQFILDYNRVYESYYEKQRRLEIFKNNVHEINSYNRDYNNTVMGINHFSDMSIEEFRHHHIGCTGLRNKALYCSRGQVGRISLKPPPKSFDWRDHGVVTPVKYQGGCGSCWAFSTIGNIESQYALKHNKMQLDLSEQQLVDCDKSNTGCNGGIMDKAILNLVSQGGVMSENDYRYVGKDGDCLFNLTKVQAKVTGCVDFSGADEETIKSILVHYGPLTVALGARYMPSYQRGVLQKCDRHIDHALLVVGYGTDKQTNLPYWIIKNSWSEKWGENGYLRLVRGNHDCEFGQYVLLTSQVA